MAEVSSLLRSNRRRPAGFLEIGDTCDLSTLYLRLIAVDSPNLEALFEVAGRRCAEGAADLEAQVRSLGGEPAKGESIKRIDASRLDQHCPSSEFLGQGAA